jgi:hypothetical protein
MSKAPSTGKFKQKAMHELWDFLVIAVYLGFFFCALVVYTMLLVGKSEVGYLSYTFAIVNALVIAKVILIGEMAHLGRHAENRPLYISIFYKAVLFALLVLAFHFLEDFIKSLIHGEAIGSALEKTDFKLLFGRLLLMFFSFIPLFGFIELRRVLGEGSLYKLLGASPGGQTPAKPILES